MNDRRVADGVALMRRMRMTLHFHLLMIAHHTVLALLGL